MASYPPEAWKQLSPEDKVFMRQAKQVFGNVKYEGEKGPEGVKVFPVTPWKHGGYWK